MEDVVIVAAARTAIGSFMGTLSTTPAAVLGAKVVQALLARTGLQPNQIDEVIMGHVLTAGCGENPARQVAVNAGLPVEVPAFTINKLCGSGLKAVHLGYQSIIDGDNQIVIVGGEENMSMAPHVLMNSRNGARMGDWKLQDTMLVDGLVCAFNNYHMGITAENIAEKYGISREEQDAFAYASQQKAIAAIDSGRFKEQIVGVEIKSLRAKLEEVAQIIVPLLLGEEVTHETSWYRLDKAKREGLTAGVLDLVAIKLGQSIHGLRQQFRRWVLDVLEHQAAPPAAPQSPAQSPWR